MLLSQKQETTTPHTGGLVPGTEMGHVKTDNWRNAAKWL